MKLPPVISVCFLFAILLSASIDARTGPFILGADISWIPEREAAGTRYSDNGVQKDIFQILKDHQFNYIRLRIFNNPAAPSGGSVETTGAVYSGYSPQGYCGLAPTKAMALRIKAAGMKFLLDFHYSDNWADPSKQYKPHAWANADFSRLTDSVRRYTTVVLTELKNQGTLPDMVQVGNEIVGGMIWPDGRSSDMARFAALVNAGIDGVKAVDSNIAICIHSIAERSPSTWLANLVRAGVDRIDVFGLSYYSEWHGTPDTLRKWLNEIVDNHAVIKIMVAEYADNHRVVNDIVYGLQNGRGVGAFVWEPADWRETLFDLQGNIRLTNARIDLYPQMSRDYGNDTFPTAAGVIPPAISPPGYSIADPAAWLAGFGPLDVHCPAASPMHLALFTVSGKMVRSLTLNGKEGQNRFAGNHEIRVLPRGLYIVSLKVHGAIVAQRVAVK
jgi:arabinogalactan endo-1,4-beta-galactosidase